MLTFERVADAITSLMASCTDRRVAIVREVEQVVVDAFTDPDDGLAPAADRSHPVRDALQVVERLAGAIRALLIEGILDAAHRRTRRIDWHGLISLILVEARQGHRLQRLAQELVDARVEEPLVGRELLARVALSARVHDGGQIVVAHVAVDELLGGGAYGDGVERLRVQVVEHDHVEPALERLGVAATSG